ncbi:MAG: hypothetical protein AB7O52_10100 [Planctomycetota bacterium]
MLRTVLFGLRYVLWVAAIAVTAPLAHGQFIPNPNPDYQLRLTDAAGPQASVQTVDVELDNTGLPIVGFTFAVCHDSASLTAVDARLGLAVTTALGGTPPFVSLPTIVGGGVLVGVVLGNSPGGGAAQIPTGLGLELIEIDYSLDAPGGTVSDVVFCAQLNGLFTQTAVFPVGSTVETPITQDGTVTIGVAGPTFVFSVPDVTAGFDSATGVGDFNVSATIAEDPASPSFPDPTFAFSMALGHDPNVLVPTTVSPTTTLDALNGGAGPDFFGVTFEVDGFTVGVVYSTSAPGQQLAFDVPRSVIAIHYDTNAAALQGQITPVSTQLTWRSSLGTPAVQNLVGISLAGDTVPASKDDAAVTLLPGGPFLRRGDCSHDGSYNIGDALAILGVVFGAAGAPACEDACDGNDDGSLNLSDAVFVLFNLFSGGADPAAPFPGCGADPTPDALGCPAAACP